MSDVSCLNHRLDFIILLYLIKVNNFAYIRCDTYASVVENGTGRGRSVNRMLGSERIYRLEKFEKQ